jgi:hypothetical protein
MPSLNTMVKRVSGLQGTRDLNDWEEKFVANVVAQTRGGDDTTSLTEKQITSLERIFEKHFSG